MGFFHTVDPPAPKTRATLNRRVPIKHIPAVVSGCTHCPLNTEKLNSPKMNAMGASQPDVYVLGGSPTTQDDRTGALFSDSAGQIIVKALSLAPLHGRVRYHNVVKCCPGSRDPTTLEVQCCRSFIESDIATSKPKLVLLLGSVPLHWMIRESNVTAWRNRYIPVSIAGHKCYAMPLFSPGLVLSYANKREGPELHEILVRDLTNVIAMLHAGTFDEPPLVLSSKDLSVKSTSWMQQNIHALSSPHLNALKEMLAEALTWDEMALDIETTGLRPYSVGSRILTISVSNYDKTYAFGYEHSQMKWGHEMPAVRQVVRGFLLTSKQKWAHNLAFEQEWLAKEFGQDLLWDTQWGDTMTQAYCLDERRGALGLGSLTLQYLGHNIKNSCVVDVKRLDFEPLIDVLLYNAHDAKYTYLVRMMQAERLEQTQREPVYELVSRRIPALVAMQLRGVLPNFEEVARLQALYTVRIAATLKVIESDSDWVSFKKTNKAATPTSSDSVLAFFKDHLARTEVSTGSSKAPAYSTDATVLALIKHPVAAYILELRNANKMLSTYIEPYIKGHGKHVHADGLIHAVFNLMLTSSGRLSCEDPNLQNFPNRKGKEIRKVIWAPKNRYLVSIDYGQIEARVIGMASKDRVLCDTLWEGYDIHQDWAERLASAYPNRVGGSKKLKDKDAIKAFRSDVKNQWTFPLFFGSTLDSVSRNLQIPKDILKPLFNLFWSEFSGVRAWQHATLKSYEESGFVETLTGRRRHGPLSSNEAINMPIQGTASDIVTEGMVALSNIAFAETLPDLQPIINIHDDLTFYFANATLEVSIERAVKEMCSIRFDFINVPITVEVSVGETWDAQEQIAVFSSVDFGHKRETASRQTKAFRPA